MKKSVLSRYLETAIVTLTVLGMTLANFWHVIGSYLTNPPGTIFIGISHYHEDYFYYLSQLTQGAMGAWDVRNLYTSEAIPAQPLWWPNILLGKIVALTGLPPWTVYDIAVFLTAGMSLIVLYAFARRLYPGKQRAMRVAAFVIAAVTSAFYTVGKTPAGAWTVIPHRFFYDYTESLNRLGGVFHLILQNILTVIVILAAARILKFVFYGTGSKASFWKNTFAVSLSVFLLAYINPVYVFVDGVAVTLTALILLPFKRPGLNRIAYLPVALFVVAVPLILPYLAMQDALKQPFFQYFRWWETNVEKVPPQEFFLSMAPVAVLAAAGLIPFLKKGGPLRLLGVVWTVFPLTIYFTWIPIYLQVPFFRLPQPPQYIVIGAMIAEAFALPWAVLKKLHRPKLGRTVFVMLLILWTVIQLPMIATEVADRENNVALTSWLNHLDPRFYAGMMFLRKQPHDKIAMGVNNTELLIPALTGMTVYEGHHSLTYHYPEKVVQNSRFFMDSMTPEEARAFLAQYHVGYIIWKAADGDVNTFASHYPFLKVLYQNPGITIFTPSL